MHHCNKFNSITYLEASTPKALKMEAQLAVSTLPSPALSAKQRSRSTLMEPTLPLSTLSIETKQLLFR